MTALYLKNTVVTEHSYSNLRSITKRKHFRGFLFYVCNVTFGRLKQNHLDEKPNGSVTATVMLCHVLMHDQFLLEDLPCNFVE